MSDFLKAKHLENIPKGIYDLIAPCAALDRPAYEPDTSFPVIVQSLIARPDIASVQTALGLPGGWDAINTLHCDPWFQRRRRTSIFTDGKRTPAEVLASFSAGQAAWAELDLITQRAGGREEAVEGLSDYRLHDHMKGFLVTFNDSAVMLISRRLECLAQASVRFKVTTSLAIVGNVITPVAAYKVTQMLNLHLSSSVPVITALVVGLVLLTYISLYVWVAGTKREAVETFGHIDGSFRSAFRRNAQAVGEHLRSRLLILGQLQDKCLTERDAARDRNGAAGDPANAPDDQNNWRKLGKVIGLMRSSALDFSAICNDIFCALAIGMPVRELYNATFIRIGRFHGVDKMPWRYAGLVVMAVTGTVAALVAMCLAWKLPVRLPVLVAICAGLAGFLILLAVICGTFMQLDHSLCKLIDPVLVAELAAAMGPAPYTPSPDNETETGQSDSERRRAERDLRRDRKRRR